MSFRDVDHLVRNYAMNSGVYFWTLIPHGLLDTPSHRWWQSKDHVTPHCMLWYAHWGNNWYIFSVSHWRKKNPDKLQCLPLRLTCEGQKFRAPYNPKRQVSFPQLIISTQLSFISFKTAQTLIPGRLLNDKAVHSPSLFFLFSFLPFGAAATVRDEFQ